MYDQSARDLCVTSVDRRPTFLCLVNINFIFIPEKKLIKFKLFCEWYTRLIMTAAR